MADTPWPGYDLTCLSCGAGCRPIDRFCSQCGRPNPTGAAESPESPTIVVAEEAPDLTATFISDMAEEGTDRTAVMSNSRRRTAHAESIANLETMLVPGAVFGRRYRVQRLLGTGAMGHVCSAVDESIDEVVALKILSAPIQEDPDSFERFKLELKLARKIRHRNVVQSFDLGFADGYPYISMEYIDADNLATHIHRRGQFDETEALMIMRQVLRGLRAAHDLGVIHRDIKPENILLNKDKLAFITDFGIATSADFAKRKELAGTPDYMAPEQLRCEEVTPASDLYSSGVVLYRMLTGALPYRATKLREVMEAHLHSSPEPIPEELNISASTRAMIAAMLAKDPADRPQNAKEILDLIEPLLKRAPARSGARRRTALVVEHDSESTAFLREALEMEGYKVVTANNARDGVTRAFEETPSVIFLDARISGGYDLALEHDPSLPKLDPNLSGVDGLGFCRILRGDAKLRQVPVVVMSEQTLSNLRTSFEESGAADVVLKPLTRDDVSATAKRLVPPILDVEEPMPRW